MPHPRTKYWLTIALLVFVWCVWQPPHAAAATKTWTGATDSDWTKGTNWGGTAPASGDTANIPGGLTNYPIITSSITIATLNINSAGSGASVTVSSGGTLNVSSALTVNANGILTVNGGTILCAGTLTDSATVSISSGTIHMASALATTPSASIVIGAGDTLTQSGGAVDTRDLTTTAGSPNGTYNQSNGTLKIYRDFKSSGTFNGTGGTVEFAAAPTSGTWPATTGPTQFFNVLMSVDPSFDQNAALSISVAGDWTANVAVNPSGRATTFTFNGSGAQSIGGSATTTFTNVTVNKSSGTATLAHAETLTGGNLTVSAGTLDLSSFTINRSASGGTLTVSNGAFLKIGGTNTFPTNYATHTLGATGTVEYNGTNQTVTVESYGHLTLSGSGTKTMPGSAMTIAGNFAMAGTASATAAQALTVNGNFTLGANTTFGAASYSHIVKGNLSNSGTFTASTSTFTLNGTSAQTIGGSNSSTFNSLTINNSNGISLSGVDVTVGGALTFTSGNITTSANTVNIPSGGSVSRTSGHVVGNFRKNVATGATSRTFEIGDASNYTPVSVVFGSVTVAGDLTASSTAGDHANIASATINAAKSVNRTWKLTNSGIFFNNYNATFTFVSGDVDSGTDTNSVIAGRYSGGTWSYPTVGTKASTTTQVTGVTSFGDFQIGEASYTLSGNIFEDVNYGGGAGRNKTSSSGTSRSGARVELYTSGGVYSTSTTTDGNGDYSFTTLAAGTYYIRVVNSTVTSSRTGYTSSALAVQTYRTDATSGSAAGVTDYVGGTDPSIADPGNGSAGATFNTTTYVFTAVLSGTAQSVTKAVVSSNIAGLDFGFNFDTVVNTNGSGQGSLRQFITNVNLLSNTGLAQSGRAAGIDNAIWMISNGTAAPGLRAAFNYFSGGVATIAPNSALPAITDPVILDAQTQPGWTTTPIIQLSGTSAGAGARGLDISAGGSTVRGFIINAFTGGASSAGIWIATAGNNTIQGNYLGTNAAGSAASANYQGIYVNNTAGNVIGGNTANQRNILSGNTWRGIMFDNGASGNTVKGNYIGLDVGGTAAIANNLGISIWNSPNNIVGGTGAGDGNVISGNTQVGIYLVFSPSSGNTIQGNTIGLNAARSAAVPNVTHGVEVCCAGNGGSNNTIGGTAAGAANVISGNGGVGVRVGGGTGNSILTNVIYGNAGIGIDLGSDNVTVNNGTKNGTLPNSDMDFPVFTTAVLSGTTLTVVGYVGSAPSQSTFANARVEIFKSDNDASGYGEGQIYLGFVTADANGNINTSLTVAGLSVGNKITATATDAANSTSEFNANFVVTAPAPNVALVKSVDPSGTQPPGADLAYTVVFSNSGMANAQSLVISDPIPANTDFKVGSVTTDLGTTGLTVAVEYSNDSGSTWTYTPASGGGGAPAGYDRLVTNIRWTFTGNLSQVSPNNTGNVSFTARIR